MRCPAAIAQLGASVTLLDRDALATGDLARFDVIVTGTRAYAVREDLRAHNRRLLDWVRGGGRMVVLYNTPEFVPDQFAPYDATLPANAEEVSEQAAAVEILAPTHAFLRDRTRSPAPTSTAGSSSAGRSSSRRGTPTTRRWSQVMTRDSPHSAAAG